MRDGLTGPRTFKLHPGDVACGGRGDRLETLLGSCVAIILTDPRRTVGAMCHVVHAGRRATDAPTDATHGSVALVTMFRLLVGWGITPRLCEAWVYGGANMFPQLATSPHVGEHNGRWALAALAAEGVRVLHHDLGGTAYRRVGWTVGPGLPEVSTPQAEPALATPSSRPCR